jgi:hypothetical protein
MSTGNDKSIAVEYQPQRVYRARNYRFDTWRIRRNAYMVSPEWARVRKRKLLEMPFCEKCHASAEEWKLDVHHKHYRSFGNEQMRDLLVLCRHCHQRLHDIQHRMGYTVEEATEMFMSGDILLLLARRPRSS